MSKRKRYNPQYNKRKKLNLDDVSDTSETLDNKYGSGISRKDSYEKVDEVPPPFEGERSQKFITWSDISLTYRIVVIGCSIILGVVVPSIWFASGLNTKVTNLKEDVTEIKQTTKNIVESTINNTNRLNYIEKEVDEVKHKVERNSPFNDSPPKPNKANAADAKSRAAD